MDTLLFTSVVYFLYFMPPALVSFRVARHRTWLVSSFPLSSLLIYVCRAALAGPPTRILDECTRVFLGPAPSGGAGSAPRAYLKFGDLRSIT
jgi:hypothetical protein